MTLLGVRHANGRPGVDGKCTPNSSPHLFELEFTVPVASSVPRTSRVFVEADHLLSGVSAHDRSRQSLVVVPLGQRGSVPMDHRCRLGATARRFVTGPSEDAGLFSRFFRQAACKGLVKEVTSNEVGLPLPRRLRTKASEAVWGAVKNISSGRRVSIAAGNARRMTHRDAADEGFRLDDLPCEDVSDRRSRSSADRTADGRGHGDERSGRSGSSKGRSSGWPILALDIEAG